MDKYTGEGEGKQAQTYLRVRSEGLVVALVLISFIGGRLSVISEKNQPSTVTTSVAKFSNPSNLIVQNSQPSDDPRELIPIPGPGTQPGFGPGAQPGDGTQPGECPMLLYQDGQLYQLLPGQGGLLPVPGQPGGGLPGEGPELFPLEPAPRLPLPRTPPGPQQPNPFPPSRVIYKGGFS